jgi:hypothetical protein
VTRCNFSESAGFPARTEPPALKSSSSKSNKASLSGGELSALAANVSSKVAQNSKAPEENDSARPRRERNPIFIGCSLKF